jgi:hypothetical protein|tara:strand:+ start:525 stop:743 length:219 start_codon:yes stop_codon:yes gene_type:complete
MQKNYFHNSHNKIKNSIRRQSPQYSQFHQDKTVDINILLNKVKLDKKYKIKKKYILFISGSALIAVTALLAF